MEAEILELLKSIHTGVIVIAIGLGVLIGITLAKRR